MKTMRFAVLLLSTAVIGSAFAATPDLRDWDHSPQGYFMTKAEHQEWSALRTPDEQQHFIDQFLAKRGPNFQAEVAARADQADKHLTIGKTPGSKALRGKMVILLGPPTGMDISDFQDVATVHHSSPAVANAYSGGSNATADDDSNEGSKTMGSANIIRNYHFTYATTPAGALDVTISADPNSGKDRARGRDDAKRLEAVFEAAAQASIKNK